MEGIGIQKSRRTKRETVDLTPHRSILPKSGKTGYSLTQAIAELVDNAIDSRLPNETLEINVVLQPDSVKVSDDGSGMGRADIEKSLVLGHSEKINQLGEFGIGMKAACTSLGRKFEVITSRKGFSEGYIYEYDEAEWLANEKKNDWTATIEIFEKTKTEEHGTMIHITSLNRSINRGRKVDVLRDFGNRFAPFLLSSGVSIFVNREECMPEKPELIEEGKSHFEIKLNNGEKIYGWYGLLKRGSNRLLYGFNTFRRGRMITSYDKLGIPYHPTVSKIIGEIHMDHVPVSTNKRGWETESAEFSEAEQLLKKEFREIVAKARRSSMQEKLDKKIIDETEVWKENIVRVAQSEIRGLDETRDSKRKRTDNTEDPIGQVIIERRDPKLDQIHQKIKSMGERQRNPKKRQTVVSHFITVGGKRYAINHIYAPLGEDKGWKDVYYKEGEPIEVYTNQDFPAYAVTSDLPFYAAVHIAEGLGEIIAQINNDGIDKALEMRERLLRKAAEFIDEFKSKN